MIGGYYLRSEKRTRLGPTQTSVLRWTNYRSVGSLSCHRRVNSAAVLDALFCLTVIFAANVSGASLRASLSNVAAYSVFKKATRSSLSRCESCRLNRVL